MLVLNFYFFDIFEVQPEQRQFCISIKLKYAAAIVKHAAAIVKYAAAIAKHAASIDRSVMFGMARQPVGPLRSCKGEEMNPMALRARGTSQRGSHRTWWGCPGPAPAVSRACPGRRRTCQGSTRHDTFLDVFLSGINVLHLPIVPLFRNGMVLRWKCTSLDAIVSPGLDDCS